MLRRLHRLAVSPSCLSAHTAARPLILAPSPPLRLLRTSAPTTLPRSAKSPLSAPKSDPPHRLTFESSSTSPGTTQRPAPPTPPSPPTFSSAALSFEPVDSPLRELPNTLEFLRAQAHTTFLPGNQHLPTPVRLLLQGNKTLDVLSKGEKVTLVRASNDKAEEQTAEPVLALTTPFEGGESHVVDAVRIVARDVGAELLRFDLAMGLGFHGSGAPLEDMGYTAPPLPSSANPILQLTTTLTQDPDPETPHDHLTHDDQEGEQGEPTRTEAVSIPMLSITRSPMQSSPERSPTSPVNDEWVEFFTRVVNHEHSEGQRRIILLESSTAMSSTFDIWWPSFVEAVRRRRSNAGARSGRGKAKQAELRNPTTVILSCTPSFLHVGSDVAQTQPAQSFASHIAAKLGGVVEDRPDAGPQIWWAGDESDEEGRLQRDQDRLEALRSDKRLVPTFESAKAPRNPAELFMGMFPQDSVQFQTHQVSISRVLPIVPEIRDPQMEAVGRIATRQLLNVALVAKAMGSLGGVIDRPLDVLDSLPTEWGNTVFSLPLAQRIASSALGLAVTQLHLQKQTIPKPLVLGWPLLQLGFEAEHNETSRLVEQAAKYRKDSPAQGPNLVVKGRADPVVEELMRSKTLSQHERRLLPCIVDPTKVSSTTFADVHLPEKTIDTIRSIISLPLLFPDAFRSGILKNHSTSGALLFGPPGTGKTLLARAVASESGARMLAIQPSDIYNMWLGESEKAVKAVFSLARKLSPCVVFIDEVDALFAARQANSGSGSAMAHNQTLTEFMQELDGLSSASANKDKRLVVVGATNRPFALDDAVLRRLPRRVLVDLPGPEDRKAILKILLREEELAEDVDLDHIAKETESFSGSDLQHLCVSAALAATKEMVQVPWRHGGSPAGATAAVADEPNSGDGAASESAVLAYSIKVPTPIHPHKQPIAVTPLTPLDVPLSPVITCSNAASEPSEPALGEAEARGGEPAPASSASQTPLTPISSGPRLLAGRHFTAALSEIRASSTEEGTIAELRKFAEQYGEGGTRRGKTNGFGLRFGFGGVSPGQDEGYGKVLRTA